MFFIRCAYGWREAIMWRISGLFLLYLKPDTDKYAAFIVPSCFVTWHFRAYSVIIENLHIFLLCQWCRAKPFNHNMRRCLPVHSFIINMFLMSRLSSGAFISPISNSVFKWENVITVMVSVSTRPALQGYMCFGFALSLLCLGGAHSKLLLLDHAPAPNLGPLLKAVALSSSSLDYWVWYISVNPARWILVCLCMNLFVTFVSLCLDFLNRGNLNVERTSEKDLILSPKPGRPLEPLAFLPSVYIFCTWCFV